jgi:hypothetical protein
MTVADFQGMVRRTLGLSAAVFVALITALHGQPTVSPATWRIRDLPAELRPSVSRADIIIVTMHDALLRELDSGLEKGGPARAIKSCHIDAAWVAQRVGRQEGIAAGRTGDRLRNPLNAPKPWAAPMVAANAGRRAADVDGFAVDLGDRLGVLRPIAQRPSCAACHGRDHQLSTAIREELRDRYPSDRATGFMEGEIRGWYWVEIPKRPAR